MSNVPKLRFPEFSDTWVTKQLTEVTLSQRLGGNYANSEAPTEHPLIKMGNLERGKVTFNKIEYIPANELKDENDRAVLGDVFFNTRNTLDLVGKVAIWRDELPVAYYNSNILRLRFQNNFFMNYCLNTHGCIKSLRRIATGTTSVAAIYSRDLFKIPISFPSEEEQQKIAAFLTAVDTKIEQLTQKEALLKQYKKGVMQKIFSQEIRFKADDGSEFPEWEEKKFGEVFERITTKNKENNQNVLTISAQQGLVNQEDYFNKSVAAQDITGYYLLHKDDFAYNKSYSKGYPLGAIKRLTNYKKGVVSTLYICFRSKNCVTTFAEQFFENGGLNREIHKIAQEGARNHGLLNMSVIEFFKDIELPLPCREEQLKISEFLANIDSKIGQATEQLTSAKTFKKGLLQQMFV